MGDLLKKLRRILTKRELKQFAWLCGAILAMGLFEVVGIVSIMPFMQLVAQPGVVQESEWLSWLYDRLGFQEERAFLFAAGAAVLILLAVSNTVSALTQWFQFKYVWNSAHTLAKRLLSVYMYQPYEFFLGNNSAELGKQVLDEVNTYARSVLLPLVQLCARAFVAFVILALLFLVDPQLALTVFVVLGSVYALIYFGVRTYLDNLGKERFGANRLRYKTANEALAGIKLVKIRGSEDYFIDRFAAASKRYSRVQPIHSAIAGTPRYFVETLAFGGILTVVLYLLAVKQSLSDVIPLLSLYALAGYRLLPALQQIFVALSTFRYNVPVVDSLYRDLQAGNARPAPDAPGDLTFAKEIRLRNVSFQYAGSDKAVLRNINLTIPHNARVAFVGPTGSGKTTLVDILMGLLRPRSGEVLIDGAPLADATVSAWQKMVGYVPQEVALYDETVARNIVFGVADGEFDAARMQQVARMAKVHGFIVDELPRGYDTLVGERGVRLSGGQRQRIGLARALYHDPEVLILDEATSALDGITEDAVMDAIGRADKQMTTILIAHRLSTVQDCDCIYLLEQGRIVAEGTYDDLMATNATFRGMAKAIL